MRDYGWLVENKDLQTITHDVLQDEGIMASNSKKELNTAAMATNEALAKLEIAIELALSDRAASAAARESVQTEISSGWQKHHDKLEAALNDTQAENAFLQEDVQRLTKELQALKAEYQALKGTANSTLTRLNTSVSQLDLILEASA